MYDSCSSATTAKYELHIQWLICLILLENNDNAEKKLLERTEFAYCILTKLFAVRIGNSIALSGLYDQITLFNNVDSLLVGRSFDSQAQVKPSG